MRTTLALVVAGLCALAIAGPVTKPYYKTGDKVFLEKQKDVLRLFNYINQPSYYKDFVEIANAFKFEGMWSQWTKPEYAKEFYYMYTHDFLPQGEIFSVFYPEHLEQAIALFKTFYYAKDYETFYKTAVWARQNVNEGMFIYAYSVAIVHSKFTEGIILPPIYEIYPHYFFNDEVIYKAQQYKQHYWGTYEHEEEIKDSFKGYTLHANYSGWYMNVHPEQSLSYFTEDVGVNAHYYYYSGIFNPWWLPSEILDYDSSYRGQYFYYFHQQFLARYYLERLSNGMGEIPHYSYEHPIETGYYPSLHYPNGLHFPTRPNHANLHYHSVHGEQSYPWYGNYTHSYTYVKDYERRLRDALDMGFFYTPEGKMVQLFDKEGFETLGNLVESNYKSENERYYGDLLVFARHLLGYAYHPTDEYKLAPSALEHFETSLRDPMFWQMYKRIMFYFHQHQEYTGPYEKKQLYFDGIKIEDVTVDRLMTYFDYYYSDLSNAVVVDEKEFNEDSFLIRARQHRLNHKPFNYKIAVNSDKPVEAFVKVFIGPKYDEYGREIDIDMNRHNFFEFDRFRYTLQAGKNFIERNSHESMYFAHDRTTYLELYQKVMTSFNGGAEFKYYPMTKYYGMPHRMLLPKGDFGGQTYQMFFMIAPYHSSAKVVEDDFGFDYVVDHEYTLGYPFDRPIQFEQVFEDIPNFYFKDVVIYHKNTEAEFNTAWSQH